jgi:hypothetical protein
LGREVKRNGRRGEEDKRRGEGREGSVREEKKRWKKGEKGR